VGTRDDTRLLRARTFRAPPPPAAETPRPRSSAVSAMSLRGHPALAQETLAHSTPSVDRLANLSRPCGHLELDRFPHNSLLSSEQASTRSAFGPALSARSPPRRRRHHRHQVFATRSSLRRRRQFRGSLQRQAALLARSFRSSTLRSAGPIRDTLTLVVPAKAMTSPTLSASNSEDRRREGQRRRAGTSASVPFAQMRSSSRGSRVVDRLSRLFADWGSPLGTPALPRIEDTRRRRLRPQSSLFGAGRRQPCSAPPIAPLHVSDQAKVDAILASRRLKGQFRTSDDGPATIATSALVCPPASETPSEAETLTPARTRPAGRTARRDAAESSHNS
jgi:hypothetical protein